MITTKEKALIGTKEKISINKDAFTSTMTEIRKALLKDEKDILKRRKSEIKASKEYRVAMMGYDIYNTVNTNIMIIMS